MLSVCPKCRQITFKLKEFNKHKFKEVCSNCGFYKETRIIQCHTLTGYIVKNHDRPKKIKKTHS